MERASVWILSFALVSAPFTAGGGVTRVDHDTPDDVPASEQSVPPHFVAPAPPTAAETASGVEGRPPLVVMPEVVSETDPSGPSVFDAAPSPNVAYPSRFDLTRAIANELFFSPPTTPIPPERLEEMQRREDELEAVFRQNPGLLGVPDVDSLLYQSYQRISGGYETPSKLELQKARFSILPYVGRIAREFNKPAPVGKTPEVLHQRVDHYSRLANRWEALKRSPEATTGSSQRAVTAAFEEHAARARLDWGNAALELYAQGEVPESAPPSLFRELAALVSVDRLETEMVGPMSKEDQLAMLESRAMIWRRLSEGEFKDNPIVQENVNSSREPFEDLFRELNPVNGGERPEYSTLMKADKLDREAQRLREHLQALPALMVNESAVNELVAGAFGFTMDFSDPQGIFARYNPKDSDAKNQLGYHLQQIFKGMDEMRKLGIDSSYLKPIRDELGKYFDKHTKSANDGARDFTVDAVVAAVDAVFTVATLGAGKVAMTALRGAIAGARGGSFLAGTWNAANAAVNAAQAAALASSAAGATAATTSTAARAFSREMVGNFIAKELTAAGLGVTSEFLQQAARIHDGTMHDFDLDQLFASGGMAAAFNAVAMKSPTLGNYLGKAFLLKGGHDAAHELANGNGLTALTMVADASYLAWLGKGGVNKLLGDDVGFQWPGGRNGFDYSTSPRASNTPYVGGPVAQGRRARDAWFKKPGEKVQMFDAYGRPVYLNKQTGEVIDYWDPSRPVTTSQRHLTSPETPDPVTNPKGYQQYVERGGHFARYSTNEAEAHGYTWKKGPDHEYGYYNSRGDRLNVETGDITAAPVHVEERFNGTEPYLTNQFGESVSTSTGRRWLEPQAIREGRDGWDLTPLNYPTQRPTISVTRASLGEVKTSSGVYEGVYDGSIVIKEGEVTTTIPISRLLRIDVL